MKSILTYIACLFTILIICTQATGQNATISKEMRRLNTYAFDEPNPVPILTENPKIYPYFKFEGYSHQAEEREWEVVKLENEYIAVYVLPQIGGKVWGAIEKKTGEEFLYRNEVIKFRNIAMRGPWTSGGIEFNFGIIGHTPATATPVDYKVMNNEDGSVSCVVGAMDLSSRTKWTVEIRLEKDKAYYETRASWYNATPLNQSYYNWMTGAAEASNDLEFFIPGDQYLEHGGDANPWPVDKKQRQLSNYKDNNFGPHKSYHIVGEYKDFFGGYYHDKNFGFGHWSPYEEMPGQKLWLWALSRSGGVWEDLLTDTDGQYIEFQAGRLFNQYSPGGKKNSITQANFEPYVMDKWREIWFPFVDIGGMEAASEWGVLNVEYKNGFAEIGLNALQNLNEYFQVSINGKEEINEKISMKPMDVFMKKIAIQDGAKLEVNIGNKKIYYSNDPDLMKLKRPFHSEARGLLTENQVLYFEAWENMKFREFQKAREGFLKLLAKDANHQDALVKMAELEYRRNNLDIALEYANRVLKIDTYHPEANYKAGICYREKKDFVNALESFGWAARSMNYKSVSYAQMAEINTILNDFPRAKELANKALDFNTYNINARSILAICARELGNEEEHSEQLSIISKLDPLNHLAIFESKRNLKTTSEFPEESKLELALQYYNLGLRTDAVKVLGEDEISVKNSIWKAYLLKDEDKIRSNSLLNNALNKNVDFVMPYRKESMEVFEWAQGHTKNWKTDYYLALNYYALGKNKLADRLIQNCGNTPDSPLFYRFRGQMLKSASIEKRIEDYNKAHSMEKKDWKQLTEHIQLFLEGGKVKKANELAKQAYSQFPNNYNTGLIYAKSLLASNDYEKSIEILNKINVLPSELARESRTTYYKAHVSYANQLLHENKLDVAIEIIEKSKIWPEHLGVGRPYVVDERLQDYLLGIAFEKLGKKGKSEEFLKKVVAFSNNADEANQSNNVLTLWALGKIGNSGELKEMLAKLEKSNELKDELTLALFHQTEIENETDMYKLLRAVSKY